MALESAELVKGEESEHNWADDAAVGNGAEAVAGVPGVGAFTVVAGDEKLAGGDDGIDFAGGMLFRAFSGGNAPLGVIDKSVGVLVIVNLHDAIFDGDAFAGEGDDAFDDVLVADVLRGSAGHRVFDAGGLELFGGFAIFVHEDNDLPAIRDVFLA